MTVNCLFSLSSGVIDNAENVLRFEKYARTVRANIGIRPAVVPACRNHDVPNARGKERRVLLQVDCGQVLGFSEELDNNGFALVRQKIDNFLMDYGFSADDFFVTQCEYVFSGSQYLDFDDADRFLADINIGRSENDRYREFTVITDPDADDGTTFIILKVKCKRAAIEWSYVNRGVPQNFQHWINEDIGNRLLSAAKKEFGDSEFWDYIAS